MTQRLPFVDACRACSVAGACKAANTHERCNDAVFYPAGGLHPVAKPVPELQVQRPSAIQWSEVSDRFQTISASRSGTEVLKATAVTLRGTLQFLRGRRTVPDQAVVALMFGTDRRLEQTWRTRYLLSHRLGIPVVGPAFSTWLDTTPYEHVAQSIRGLTMATQLAMYNDVVPSVALSPWVNPMLWADSLAQAPQIAVDLGSIHAKHWHVYLDLLGALADAFSPVPRLLVYGVLSVRRLSEVLSVWPTGITFVSRGPVDYAMKGERLSYPGLAPSKDWSQGHEGLILANDSTFDAVVDDLIGGADGRRAPSVSVTVQRA